MHGDMRLCVGKRELKFFAATTLFRAALHFTEEGGSLGAPPVLTCRFGQGGGNFRVYTRT